MNTAITDVSYTQVAVTGMSHDFGGGGGTHVQGSTTSDGYLIEITANPVNCTWQSCSFKYDETWQLILNEIPPNSKGSVSFESFPKGGSPTAIAPDPILLVAIDIGA
jgi:hypothetical protein